MVGHGRDELVEHGALTEEGMGPALCGVDLESRSMPRLSPAAPSTRSAEPPRRQSAAGGRGAERCRCGSLGENICTDFK